MHACVHARMYMFASRGGGGAQAAARGRHTGDKAGAAHLLAAHADGHKKALSQKLLSDLATEASARTSDNRDAPPPPSSAPPPARSSASHFAGLVQTKHGSATRSSHAVAASRWLGKIGRAAAHQGSEGAPARSCRRVRKCQRLNYHCCTRAAESRGPLLQVDVP